MQQWASVNPSWVARKPLKSVSYKCNDITDKSIMEITT